jgi:predicted small lipoprotein YifL
MPHFGIRLVAITIAALAAAACGNKGPLRLPDKPAPAAAAPTEPAPASEPAPAPELSPAPTTTAPPEPAR